MKSSVRRCAWVLAVAFLSGPVAAAGLFRAYLASGGSDANGCTVTAPCRLLPAALAAVADGGEVWMLDSANYNGAGVTVTKSVTILAVPGAVGSFVAIGGSSALTVSGVAVKVTLHNVVITNFPGNVAGNGVEVNGGASLTIEDSQMYGLPGSAVHTFSAVDVNVKRTVVRDNGGWGLDITSSSTRATLDELQIERNANGGIEVATGGGVTIARSVISSNNTRGVLVLSTGTTTSTATIRDCVIRGHSEGVSLISGSITAFTNVTVSRNAITQNVTGINAVIAPSGNINAVLDGNTITGNTLGIGGSGGPNYVSASNNVVALNTTDVGATITALTPQYR